MPTHYEPRKPRQHKSSLYHDSAMVDNMTRKYAEMVEASYKEADMEDKRLTLKQVKELQSKWMDGGCPGSLIDFLKSAGAFKPEPLENGLYSCRVSGVSWICVLECFNGKWRNYYDRTLVCDQYAVNPISKLTQEPL